MDEPLVWEWAAYRAACDAVDLLRSHPGFDDPRSDPRRRRLLVERLSMRRREAVTASARLIECAEREPDIDPGWLDELRDEHEVLVRAAARSERDLASEIVA